MAECNIAEEIEPLNSITGNSYRSKYLYWQLKEDFKTAESIDFIVSFLMESGVKMILPDLREAVNRGVKIRILFSFVNCKMLIRGFFRVVVLLKNIFPIQTFLSIYAFSGRPQLLSITRVFSLIFLKV